MNHKEENKFGLICNDTQLIADNEYSGIFYGGMHLKVQLTNQVCIKLIHLDSIRILQFFFLNYRHHILVTKLLSPLLHTHCILNHFTLHKMLPLRNKMHFDHQAE
jgi:hypothetical protein